MSVDPTIPRTRRALLAAGIGGALATVAAAIGRPGAALAANGDPVAAGQPTEATAVTTVVNTANGTGLFGISSSAAIQGQPKIGVQGYADQDTTARGVFGWTQQGIGVHGGSQTGRGVRGTSVSGTAIQGLSTSGTGVSSASTTGKAHYASTGSTEQPAILAQTTGHSTAIQGYSGGGVPPGSLPQTGLMGNANQDEVSVGAYGGSEPGTGVVGESDTGTGVFGVGSSGVYGLGYYGTIGDTDEGVGVYGWSGQASPPAAPGLTGVVAAAEAGRTALAVDGVARFSRSGSTTLTSGSTKTVTGVPLSADSLVFAVLHTNRSGVWVRAVVPNVAGSSFVIYLNTAVAASTRIAWFVAN